MISEQIPAALAGERLDRIVALIAECSRSEAVVLLEAEGVTVDGVVEVRGKLRIEEGQTVEVWGVVVACIHQYEIGRAHV